MAFQAAVVLDGRDSTLAEGMLLETFAALNDVSSVESSFSLE